MLQKGTRILSPARASANHDPFNPSKEGCVAERDVQPNSGQMEKERLHMNLFRQAGWAKICKNEVWLSDCRAFAHENQEASQEICSAARIQVSPLSTFFKMTWEGNVSRCLQVQLPFIVTFLTTRKDISCPTFPPSSRER